MANSFKKHCKTVYRREQRDSRMKRTIGWFNGWELAKRNFFEDFKFQADKITKGNIAYDFYISKDGIEFLHDPFDARDGHKYIVFLKTGQETVTVNYRYVIGRLIKEGYLND